MDFVDVFKSRTSVHEFSSKNVGEEKIIDALECARLVPSWTNKRSSRFIVIRNKKTIEDIAKTILNNRWLKTAPVLIIGCSDPLDGD